ncbi:MAG: class I SAM-dependent methyltransferase [Candidatus Sulfotelmatobacter sp.]
MAEITMTSTSTSKTERVKSLFDLPEKYLCPRRFDIQIRVETVEQFTRGLTLDRVLDIGCGDGSLSAPLLARAKHLTLLDLSSKMLELARQKVPAERSEDVSMINGSFLEAQLAPQSFDLILCVGVLAHVDSPAAIVAEIARLAKPGASIILEFTDAYHFWGWPVVVYQKLLKLLRPEPYPLNRLKARNIIRLFEGNGLTPVALYRYGMPPIGTSKFAGQEEMYQMTRTLFGPSDRNRNAWMGNEYIFHLQKA